jgi:hypothetical protein
MSCPVCNSQSFSRPRYGGIPGGRRRVAVVTCCDCSATFAIRGSR